MDASSNPVAVAQASAAALIQPLAWELPYASGAAVKRGKNNFLLKEAHPGHSESSRSQAHGTPGFGKGPPAPHKTVFVLVPLQLIANVRVSKLKAYRFHPTVLIFPAG